MLEQKIELRVKRTTHIKERKRRKIRIGAKVLRLDVCDLFKKNQENQYGLKEWARDREETDDMKELIKEQIF